MRMMGDIESYDETLNPAALPLILAGHGDRNARFVTALAVFASPAKSL